MRGKYQLQKSVKFAKDTQIGVSSYFLGGKGKIDLFTELVYGEAFSLI